MQERISVIATGIFLIFFFLLMLILEETSTRFHRMEMPVERGH
jgi:hypothetical protein